MVNHSKASGTPALFTGRCLIEVAQYSQYGQQASQGQYQQQGSLEPQGIPQQGHNSGPWHATDSGQFNGGQYSIIHRDTNSVLSVTLSEGGAVKSRSGAMIEMGGNVKIEGKAKFSMKKMFTGGTMIENTYTGPGLVTLAPVMLGDIATLRIDGGSNWRVGRHGFLGATVDVVKEAKSQGLGKALFSGEDLFVYNVSGKGLMWVSSFGAIIQREVSAAVQQKLGIAADKGYQIAAGETHVVDNGHLVAWNCEYKIEKAGGGLFAAAKTGEGLVCRFTGPGIVYLQTRNVEDFSVMVAETAGCQRG